MVAHSNSQSIITLNLRAPALRVLVVLPAVLAILGAWFVVRWYVGDTVAEYAPDNTAGAIELARLAVRWAPKDPFTHWTLGALEQKEFSASNLADAVHEFEMAVRLSPNDYRYWMELGRALEASGDVTGGERALRRAVDLAPAYSQPRWYFGNLLIREGKVDEAFQQFRRGAEADKNISPQVFNLAWEVFDGNADAIANATCQSTAMRLQLAIYLLGRGKLDDAMRVWASTPNRSAEPELAEELKKRLIDLKQFHAALSIVREIEPDRDKVPVPEQILNGGFETGTTLPTPGTFGWAITPGAQTQMAIDTRSHSGHGSLRIVFKAPAKLDNIRVSQAVVVEPNTQYHFECYARAENLNSGSTPVILILDAANNNELAASPPLPTGTFDWQRITLDFKTKPNSDGLIVRLARAPCGESQVCPIFGTIWYDDFNLQRVGRSVPSRGTTTSGKRDGDNSSSR